jgi:hypothetical protein
VIVKQHRDITAPKCVLEALEGNRGKAHHNYKALDLNMAILEGTRNMAMLLSDWLSFVNYELTLKAELRTTLTPGLIQTKFADR